MPTAYITAPYSAAEDLATSLVTDGLAACVNRIPCTSTYVWEGEVVHDEEEVLIAKTTDERYPELVKAIKEQHPYDVPCIERFDETDVLPSYREWVERETQA